MGEYSTGEPAFDGTAELWFESVAKPHSRSWRNSIHSRECGRNSCLGGVRSESDTLHGDYLDVGDAHKSEDRFQIGVLEVEGFHCTSGIDSTSRDDEVHLLPSDQSFRSVVRIAEGDTGAHYIVDICLEARGNAEVDHAGRDNKGVCGEEFRQQIIGQ